MRAWPGSRAALLCLAGITLLAAAVPLAALELDQGKVKLTLAEDTGRFSLSCLTAEGTYVPLLSPQDPRTTSLSVVLNSTIFRMGDSAGFSTAVEKTQAGGRFVWKSDFLAVTESFSFVTSTGASGADGIRIDITLKNTSRQDYSAGIRYLFDTWLGESGAVPFSTDTLASIKREATFSGRSLPRYWVSPKTGDPEQLGLQCMVTEDGVTQPDKIVFANWKRLSDAAWGYSTSEARDFSVLPYSKNDSAVAQYYGPRPLAQGTQFTVTIVLGKYNPDGLPATTLAASADFAGAVQQSLAAGKSAPGSPVGLHADLSTVDEILSRVDAALAPGADIGEGDLSLMESAISDLKARVSTYGK
ncbi:MAG: hypothetical protein ACLQCB_06115 [Spirochaetia bacterium]